MPTDPAVLMQLAAQTNGLAGAGLKPWHIKVAYQIYDSKDKPAEKGTLEEWWVNPHNYKVIFGTATSQTILYVSAQGLYLGGDKQLDMNALLLLRWMVDPIPNQGKFAGANLQRSLKEVGKSKFDCVTVTPGKALAMKDPRISIYCFEPGKPELRLAQEGFGPKVIYNTMATLGGQHVGYDMDFIKDHHIEETAHLLSGALLPHLNPDITAMPPEATGHLIPIQGDYNADPVVHAGRRIGGENPVYPPIAKSNLVQGVVTLSALISTQGTIKELKVVSSSSPLLTNAAVKAVRTWKYEPYTLSGIPVPVMTRINVVFHLGRL